jgi:hypothetical protein
MVVVLPIVLFFVVLGYVGWKRRGNPGEAGTDPQAHRNLGADGGPPNERPQNFGGIGGGGF